MGTQWEAGAALDLRDPYRLVGVGARVVLLTVLLWGGLVSAVSTVPQQRPLQDFRQALRAGQVESIVYATERDDVSELRWSDGGLIWYEAELWIGDERGVYGQADFKRDLNATDGLVLAVKERPRSGGGLFPDWPFNVPVKKFGWLVGVAWVLTFLAMLSMARPRYANRWAWFWMFTFGQIGALLFLLFEPRSLWYGIEPQPPPIERKSGGSGCLTSVVLAVASGIVFTLTGLAVTTIVQILG